MARVFIAGTGRVGTGLAIALADTGTSVVGLWNRGAAGRARAEELTGRTVAGSDLETVEELAAANIILLTVADDAIAQVAGSLSRCVRLQPAVIIAHTSGCRTAADLAPLPVSRCASVHPLCVCPDPRAAATALRRALYVIEGDSTALPVLRQLVESIGGRCETIAPESKARYHAAAVLASNLVIALVDCATAEARGAGLTGATGALIELAAGAIERARSHGIPDALTGPIARGDLHTVEAHLGTLAPDVREVYAALSRHAVTMARARGLPETSVRDLLVALAAAVP